MTDSRTGTTDDRHEAGDRVGQLRGAGVAVDRRRVGQVVIGIVLATLAILAIVFTVVGVHTNQQDDRLHRDGVPVTFTVTGCLGLLGGSGSNAAGYSCHGMYTLDGRRYSEQLPGDSFHRPGSTVAAIAVPGDPALVSPASIVATEHSSAGVVRAAGRLGGNPAVARGAAPAAAPPASRYRCGGRTGSSLTAPDSGRSDTRTLSVVNGSENDQEGGV